MEARDIAVTFTTKSTVPARRIQRQTRFVQLLDRTGRRIEQYELVEWPSVDVIAVRKPPKKKAAAKAKK